MNWKHLFASHILKRGYDYYCSDAVENFSINDNCISATVYGSECYDVEILFDDWQITYMDCSCPHAADGNNCKHMSAVLYEYDNNTNSKYTNQISDITDIVNSADEQSIKKFLIDILTENDLLLDKFKLSITDLKVNNGIANCKMYVDKIIYQYSDRDGYINYYQAQKFFDALDSIMYDAIDDLIDENCYLHAFELMLNTFKTVCSTDIDDSDGGLTELSHRCGNILDEILENLNAVDKIHCFETLLKSVHKPCDDFYTSCIEGYLLDYFDDTEFNDRLINFADKRIEYYESLSDKRNDYNLHHWLKVRLDLMINGPQEQLEFCFKHWNLHGMRKWYINNRIDAKDYQSAINTLIESMEIDKTYPGLVRNYKSQLKELYKLTGNTEQYLNMLREIVLHDGGSNPNCYTELKNFYSDDEWINIRNEILDSINPNNIDILYEIEGMYSKLIECVMKSNGLWLTQKYKKVLLPIFPNQITDKFVYELSKQACIANNRSQYSELAKLLCQLRKMPGGDLKAAKLAQEWKVTYKRRTAMMDELNRYFKG